MSWKVLITIFFFTSTALAQTPPIETNPPGDDKIVALQLNKPAPFSGQLFEAETALRWANWLQQYKLRLKSDVEREQKVCEAKLLYDATVLKATVDASTTVRVDLQTRLQRAEQARLQAEEEARNPPWYRTTMFGAIVGSVGTVALFSLSLFAVSSIN